MKLQRVINAIRSNLVAWLALFVASIAVAPPTASAYCGQYAPCEGLEIYELYPPIGTSFEEGKEGPWAMSARPGLGVVTVNVNTSPETGSDGHTLSDLYRADYSPFYFFESQTDKGIYTSSGPSRFLSAGTYYWQMEGPSSLTAEYQTPIYSFVITPKPAPAPAPPPTPPKAQPPVAPAPLPYVRQTMTLARADADVKSIIRERTGRRAHHLSDKCRLIDAWVATCKASWASTWPRSSRTILYSGTFDIEGRSTGDQFFFRGLKGRYDRCTRRFGMKRCASKFQWYN